MTADVHGEIQELGAQFWQWRARQQPRTSDDIARVERPSVWSPQWSPDAVVDYRRDRERMVAAWSAIDVSAEPVNVQVDHRLIGSALARVHWELDVLRGWQRDATFYVDQTIGAVFDVLVLQPPLDERRADDLRAALAAIPQTLGDARQNLAEEAAQPFARVAVDNLEHAGTQLRRALAALPAALPHRTEILDLAEPAAQALDHYRQWLEMRLERMQPAAAIGREAYTFFWRHVALVPHSPEELAAMGRQEWHRAVAGEAVVRGRYRDFQPRAVFGSVEEQIARQHAAELEVRDYYDRHGLLSQPSTLGHYRNLAMPAYLEPLTWLGVTDDLTSPSRLDRDGISYLPRPAENLPYFDLHNARDPRTGIVHEGVHYQQLARSFASPNPLRRSYYDSTPNEGIAFYNEEMMLLAGLFDDRPDSQLAMFSFMRLRALRVEVDVALALGSYDIEAAATFLEQAVPMDRQTAREEAAFFASTPGQAPTYQIGKLQILRLLSDATRLQGDRFDLRAFHDTLWDNGNVPLSLLRWEMLGLRDDVDALDAAS